MKTTASSTNVPVLSIALVSASALGYEILLMKLFSIIQWHHFAYMIISLALLGYGASGTFLALFQQRLLKNFSFSFVINLFLFGVSSLGFFLASQNIPFNPLEIFWGYGQFGWLFAIYLLLSLPFFFAANAIGLAMIRHKSDISLLYRADLIGAGAGSLAVLGLLFIFFPDHILQIIAVAGIGAAAVALKETGTGGKRYYVIFIFTAVSVLLLPSELTQPKPSQYKDLSRTMKVKGAEVIQKLSSPFGTLSVVKNDEVPFRYVPGLSLACTTEPPPQLAVFTNGDGISVLTKYPEDPKQLGYLDYQTSALAYNLKEQKRVLVVGAGGGSDILQALYHKAKRIDGVELNPQMIELVKTTYGDFTGGIYSLDNVNIHHAEARKFITSTKERYDLIQMSMVDSYGTSSSDLQSIGENYLYTVESIKEFVKALGSEGYVSISRWVKLPPKDSLKLFVMAVEALRELGVKEPAKHLAVIRSWQTSTLLIKKTPFEKKEIENLREFCSKRYFDIAYYHGLKRGDANRFSMLEKPYFYDGIRSILEDKESFMENYKFDLSSARDDKPYFYHYLKWDFVSEFFSLKEQGGFYLLEWGYLILIASFIQALAASIVLIILPLFKYKKDLEKSDIKLKRDILIYFFSLGIGFLFIEIYFIQKFILFLGDPIISIGIVLSSFLIFAGLGSGYSKKVSIQKGYKRSAGYGIGAILIFGLFYTFILDGVFTYLISMPESFKVLFSVFLIAPLAFAMGIPFPMGLLQTGEYHPQLIAWGWGVNGCASVISAIGAGLVSIHLGFTAVMAAALLFYITAYIFFPKKSYSK